MKNDARSPLALIGSGALFGIAAWSAYAVVEFCFSSVVFRLTRPYAMFSAWHWQLTALVVIGYLLCGLAAGVLAGAIVLFQSRRSGAPADTDVFESVAGLSLVAALLFHQFTDPQMDHWGLFFWLGSILLILLILSLRNRIWRDRLGWLTNAWVIATLWLGAGLAKSLRGASIGSGLALQMGLRLDLISSAVSGGLLILAVAAVLVGSRLRRGSSAQTWPARWNVFSCSAAGLLLAACVILAFDSPAVAGAESGAASGSTRPNLVLIVMDTVRADHLSLLGYQRDTTPNLKALAKDAVNYSNAFAASDITLTSHASLFTGMYPSWHGAYCNPPDAAYGMELSHKYPTLAETLKGGGYQTLGVAANLYLRADFGLERGFEEFRIPRPVPLLPDENRYMLRYGLRRVVDYFADTAQFDRLYTFGEDIDRELFSVLDHRSRPGDPFFVFLNYMDAHFPYVPPAPFNSRFSGRRAHIQQDDLTSEMEAISRGQQQPAGYRPHCESQYDGGIAYEDAQIGKVVDWLKRHNAYDNTMIVVTADHGEAFGEKNRVGHANSPYQNLLHVGLLIKYPHSSRRGTEALPVSLIDVVPTALAVLNVPAPPALQGQSLTGGVQPARRIYAETFVSPVTHSPDCPDGCVTKVGVEWPLKFVKNLTTGKPEFFDLSSDPHEQHNLFATQQERAVALREHLDEWSKDLPKPAQLRKKIDVGIQKGLEGNGYVQK